MINISMDFRDVAAAQNFLSAADELKKYKNTIYELDKFLRNQIKYTENISEEFKGGLQEARDYLQNLLEINSLEIYT